MPVSWKVREICPRCGSDDDIWVFEKSEATVIKRCYTCLTCECEWTELKE